MPIDARPDANGWKAHADEERRARLALTPAQRLAWLWSAKDFAARAADAASKRRNDVAVDETRNRR
jgi:hypothetical protein